METKTVTLKQRNSLKKDINLDINFWHQFPFEWWWRKKYNIPFGSAQHRAMCLIDIYWEYLEELRVTKLSTQQNEEMEFGYGDDVVKMSQTDIDNDYEDLDLSQFDKK